MPLEVREVQRHITLVTIDNQAKRNAMSRQMLGELGDVWQRLNGRDGQDCRCVVITGAGAKGFCAGADIGGDLSASEETARVVNRSLLKTSTFSKPIVAAVNGDCAGGGVELLIATDIRGAATHARFGLPEVRFAIYPFGGAAVKLVHQIGHVHASDLLLTGRLVDADHAQRIGLVNEVMPAERLMPWAMQKAEMIAKNSPVAVQAVKSQLSAMSAEHAQSREALDQQLGDRVRASKDFGEGIASFREKRPAKYD